MLTTIQEPANTPLPTVVGARPTTITMTSAFGCAIIIIPFRLGKRVEVLVHEEDVATATAPLQASITVTATEADLVAESDEDERGESYFSSPC